VLDGGYPAAGIEFEECALGGELDDRGLVAVRTRSKKVAWM
jgi:hypothetical protein